MQLGFPHQPGQVILSDEERQIAFDTAQRQARENLRMARQQLRETRAALPSYDIREIAPRDEWTMDERGNFWTTQGAQGAAIPQEWQAAFDAGLAANRDRIAQTNERMTSPNLMSPEQAAAFAAARNSAAMRPGDFDANATRMLFSQRDPETGALSWRLNPDYNPAAGFAMNRAANFTPMPQSGLPQVGVPFSSAFSNGPVGFFENQALPFAAQMINAGRALTEPGFSLPSRQDMQAIGQQQQNIGGMEQAIAQASSAFARAQQEQQQAAIRNQQAFDVQMNRGQRGGIIPNDFSRPFYGQVTGVQGFGGQGRDDAAPPFGMFGQGFGFGHVQNQGGFGFTQSQGGLGGLGGASTPAPRRDSPASSWGGVFGASNPWSLV